MKVEWTLMVAGVLNGNFPSSPSLIRRTYSFTETISKAGTSFLDKDLLINIIHMI